MTKLIKASHTLHDTLHDTLPLLGNKIMLGRWLCLMCKTLSKNYSTVTLKQYVVYHFIVSTGTAENSLKASEDALISNNSMKFWCTVALKEY